MEKDNSDEDNSLYEEEDKMEMDYLFPDKIQSIEVPLQKF